MKITEEVAETLKSYVYVYIDPRNGEPFYIGEGTGNCIFAHLDDPSESEKVARIKAIRDAGLEPQIDILRYAGFASSAGAGCVSSFSVSARRFRSSSIVRSSSRTRIESAWPQPALAGGGAFAKNRRQSSGVQ
jgi:hypothetical protein